MAESGTLLSMWSGVQSFPVTTYNKSWYKVVVSTDLQMTYFINREGGKSLMRVSDDTSEIGVCHRAEGSPEMKRRFLNKEQLSEIKASQNSITNTNWN